MIAFWKACNQMGKYYEKIMRTYFAGLIQIMFSCGFKYFFCAFFFFTFSFDYDWSEILSGYCKGYLKNLSLFDPALRREIENIHTDNIYVYSRTSETGETYAKLIFENIIGFRKFGARTNGSEYIICII